MLVVGIEQAYIQLVELSLAIQAFGMQSMFTTPYIISKWAFFFFISFISCYI